MADPSRSTIQNEWLNAVNILEQTYLYGSKNATNLLALMNTLQLSYAGDWLDEEEDVVEGIAGAISGAISDATAAAIQRPFLKQYLKSVIGRTDLVSDQEMWDALYTYSIDNGLRVQGRAFTYGTPAASGSPAGTMQILRLNRDKYNMPLEAQHIDSKIAECVLDRNTGTEYGAEVYRVRGQSPERYNLKVSGSGDETLMAALTADDSLMGNASWSGFDSSSSPTTIDSWTSSTTISSSLCTFDSTNIFRTAPSDGTTGYALNLKASNRFSQTLVAAGQTLNQDVPYLLAVVWNRAVGSAAGTLTLRMGTASTTVTVAAQTGWTQTLCPSSVPLGQSCWYRNIAQNNLTIDIDWTRTSGDLLIDDVLFVPGTFFDGGWYWAIPSSTATYVAGRVGDTYTWPDIATDSVLQKWFHRGFRRFLPSSVGSSITWTDP